MWTLALNQHLLLQRRPTVVRFCDILIFILIKILMSHFMLCIADFCLGEASLLNSIKDMVMCYGNLL